MGAKDCDQDAFLALTSEVIQALTSSGKNEKGLSEVDTWIKKVLKYNHLGRQPTRGRMMAKMFSILAEEQSVTDKTTKLIHIMGWSIELFQTACLIGHDVMDNSTTRRGRPCWHLTNGLGPKAFNDALLLERSAFHILRMYHRDQPYYRECRNFLNEIMFKTEKGHCLDLLTSSGSKPQLNLFTEERYATIVKYKTSNYCFYGPARLAMIMAGMSDKESHSEVEDVLLKIGHLFQVQDDYLDCYGDPEVMGKVGTDIQEGKCSWLVVTALMHADHDQRTVLEECYGSDDPQHVSRVKSLYTDLHLPDIYREFQDSSRMSILQDISDMTNPKIQDLCRFLLTKIVDRKG